MRRPGEKLAKRNLLPTSGGPAGLDLGTAQRSAGRKTDGGCSCHLWRQYRRTRSREKQRDVDDIIDDITLVAQAAELTGWDEWMWRTEASLALVRAVDALPTRKFTSEEATGADNCCAVCLAEFREGACAASRSRRRDPDGAAPAL